MRFLQNCILVCGVILIWEANISPGHFFYKGVAHPIGPDVAQVYEPSLNAAEPVIPVIQRSRADAETGQRVVVYIRNDYRDDDIQFTPRRTLKRLEFMVAIYCLVSLIGTLIRRYVPRSVHTV